MNTGLQDAYNLAWKLALVCRAARTRALLDSYEQERIPCAAPARDDRSRIPAGRVRQAGSPGCCAPSHRARRRDRDELERGAQRSRFAPSRRSASAIRTARSRRRCPDCRRARRGRASAFPGCGSVRKTTFTGRSTTRASTCWCSATRGRKILATWSACMSLRPRRRTSGSSRAPGSAGRHSICCAPTAMSDCADRGSTRLRSGAGSPNAPSRARDRERA